MTYEPTGKKTHTLGLVSFILAILGLFTGFIFPFAIQIIGIILGVTAIGLFIWLKNNQKMSNDLHEGDLIAAKHAYEALMSDFNNYQIETDRKVTQLEKNLEYQNNKLNKQSDSASKRMDQMNKSLPSIIGRVVGQIEFAQDKINRVK